VVVEGQGSRLRSLAQRRERGLVWEQIPCSRRGYHCYSACHRHASELCFALACLQVIGRGLEMDAHFPRGEVVGS
jgi:hypothetical protein